MDAINDLDIWRQIPPEEKLAMMAKAQSKGLLMALLLIVIGCTCAVGLQIPSLIWGSLLSSPLVFQFTANRVWRDVKPATVLRYLAARSAARRYAFSQKSKDLDIKLIFRGKLERIFSDDNPQDALEAAIAKNLEAEVWIALFPDTIVMISEARGGAKLEFGYPINEKLQMRSESESGQDYTNNKEIYLGYPTTKLSDVLIGKSDEHYVNFKLTSPYPAALLVFEKRIEQYRQQLAAVATTALKPPSKGKLPLDLGVPEEPDDDMDRLFGGGRRGPQRDFDSFSTFDD